MEAKGEEKAINIQELQKEVVEMRQEIPEAYRVCLEKNFDDFKNRLTNIVAQRNSIEYSRSDNPDIDISVFESNASQSYDIDDLTRYISNAQLFVNNLKNSKSKRI